MYLILCYVVCQTVAHRHCSRTETAYGRLDSARDTQTTINGGSTVSAIYDSDLPWHCGSNMTWIDLGESFHPRYISELYCEETSCWHGHFRCKPVYRTMRVLKANDAECLDMALPPSLRQDWLYAEFETVAYCQCGR